METIDTPIKGIRTDLFEGIRYEKRANKSGAVFGIPTPRRFLPKWKFDITWKYVSAGILVADRYRLHSTEDLFNNAEVWAGYDVDLHRDFGRCVAYFTNERNRMLPVSCVNPHQTNKLYQVIYK